MIRTLLYILEVCLRINWLQGSVYLHYGDQTVMIPFIAGGGTMIIISAVSTVPLNNICGGTKYFSSASGQYQDPVKIIS